ncbi:hypothetical protein E5F05_09035 [Deinococcus metallilatus]|uniref:Uncharacterized protein n=1 Tax=Deinococcus metallilatus TaxID=1211322 RepID=A0AAJ5F4Q8_9DEIO|nr:hypothetical protein [Deinococcus metallilatus]MBB5295392.1 hypothetical protein [Deinococcus metallilatus]QBY08078.1 hypothetical protein E5F05_09035 [Deinococcus metallilatus]RXJ12971.1 hypothetical protein ERJ73_07860 [Deinococcus metallilatus]TLK27107.1 hypothetical protein FCS05_09455 [Deinococcus metallilatus]
MLVFDGQTTHLSGALPQEQGWTEGADGWSWPGRHPALIANTAVTLPGGTVAAGILAHGLETLGPQRLAALLVHEAFHVFQAIHPSPAWEANELDALTYPRTELTVAHARAQEAVHLAAALAHPEGWEAAARQALAWRSVRFEHLHPEHVRYEQRMETVEGLAHFVEICFLKEFPRLDGGQDAGANVREWAYRSGAALAHLVARRGEGWQTQVMAGIPLDELLAAQVSAAEKPEPSPELLEAARRAVQAADSQLTALVTEFRSLPGPRLTLQAEVPWSATGFDPLNVLALPDGSLLHRRYLRLTGPTGELEVMGASAVTHGPQPLNVTRLEVAGLPAGLEPSLTEGRWRLVSESLQANVPAQATTQDDQGGWNISV